MKTRTKLLVAIISVLFVVLMCALGFSILASGISNSHRAALRTTCASRLKTVGVLVAAYAAQYDDALPATGARWHLDV